MNNQNISNTIDKVSSLNITLKLVARVDSPLIVAMNCDNHTPKWDTELTKTPTKLTRACEDDHIASIWLQNSEPILREKTPNIIIGLECCMRNGEFRL